MKIWRSWITLIYTSTRSQASGGLSEFKKVLENMQRIAKERNSLENQLRFKERECQLLSKLKEKDKVFEVKIHLTKKWEKIKNWGRSYKGKNMNSSLPMANPKPKREKRNCYKLKHKWKRNTKRWMSCREREELACTYNIEKLQVSTRIQITVVAASDQEEMKVKLEHNLVTIVLY